MSVERAIQAAALVGLGVGLCVGERPASAGDDCPLEGGCTFKKPVVLIVLDASSAMNADFVAGQTRWEAAVESIENLVMTDAGFFDQNMRLALLRYGHDPDPDTPGTTIPLDPSGLVDGVALDVHWYDPVGDPAGFVDCTGAEIVAALDALAPPLCLGIGCTGVEPETNRALQVARSLVESSRADHPDDLVPGDERRYDVLLFTQGAWVPADEDPAATSAAMFDEDDVRTWVVVFDEAGAQASGDAIAFAGGTAEALLAGAGTTAAALEAIVDEVASAVVIPDCTPILPRVMFVVDASSDMLNVGGVAGGPGQTPWDQARALLSGAGSLFDAPVPEVGYQVVDDLVHGGVVVYGNAEPPEERLLVQYGACREDNVGWALDPNTSCGVGCVDPWGGPPIVWTFVGPGDAAYPSFDEDTWSHMPRCEAGAVAGACEGSSAFLHRGLELVDANLHAYQAAPPPGVPLASDAPFIDVLIVGRSYAGASTHAQVESALMHLHGNDGVTTLVLAVSDDVPASELADLACWGSGGIGQPCTGGSTGPFDLSSVGELQAALAAQIGAAPFDPCCAFQDCSFPIDDDSGKPPPGSDGSDTMDTGDATTSTSTGSGSEAGDTTTIADATSRGSDAGLDDSAGEATSWSPPDPLATTGGGASMSGTAGPGSTSLPGGTGTDTDAGAGQLARDGCACTQRSGDAPRPAWLWLAGFVALARRRAPTSSRTKSAPINRALDVTPARADARRR